MTIEFNETQASMLLVALEELRIMHINQFSRFPPITEGPMAGHVVPHLAMDALVVASCEQLQEQILKAANTADLPVIPPRLQRCGVPGSGNPTQVLFELARNQANETE